MTLTPRLRMLVLAAVAAVIIAIVVVVVLASDAGSQVQEPILCHLGRQLDCGGH